MRGAGYDLRVSSVTYADGATAEVVLAEDLIPRASIKPRDGDEVIVSKSDHVRTFTISGAGAAFCRFTPDSELKVTLRFEDTANTTDCDASEMVLEAAE